MSWFSYFTLFSFFVCHMFFLHTCIFFIFRHNPLLHHIQKTKKKRNTKPHPQSCFSILTLPPTTNSYPPNPPIPRPHPLPPWIAPSCAQLEHSRGPREGAGPQDAAQGLRHRQGGDGGAHGGEAPRRRQAQGRDLGYNLGEGGMGKIVKFS